MSDNLSSRLTPSKTLTDQYGDWIFTACASLLSDSHQLESTVRAILKEIKKESPAEQSERAWIFNIVWEHLSPVAHRQPRTARSLDSESNELEKLETLMKSLPPEDHFILILRDQFKLDWNEIAAALSKPEASVKLTRSQALARLEDWIWNR